MPTRACGTEEIVDVELDRMMACRSIACALLLGTTLVLPLCGDEPGDARFVQGPRAGSLKSEQPLPIYAADPQHLWNRLFAAFYLRVSDLPDEQGRPLRRVEGGDYIDFLAWGGSQYWSRPETLQRVERLLDEFLDEAGAEMQTDPLRRALLLRDLWAPYDFYIEQNIRRNDAADTRSHRQRVCGKLARILASLTLSSDEVAALPDNYRAAVASGAFAPQPAADGGRVYLPPGLLAEDSDWVEIDFYQPDLHEDLYDRFLTLHSREYRGRSYFRIFYRFPGGRPALSDYLKQLDADFVDWRQAAQDGFILLKPDAPQIPVGTEVALIQFMMTLDKQLQPVPTPLVESLRHRAFHNVDGSNQPPTNTGVGMQVMEYTLKRQLLFDDLRQGGLAREPESLPQYRVIFQPPDAPDWGTDGRKVLFQQCADCHMTPRADRPGVHSLPSIVHMGGFVAGAQLGLAQLLPPGPSTVHAARTARWKAQHETYRRLREFLD